MSVAVGWLLLAAGLKYFVALIAFYFLGSAATKFRSAAKMGLVSEGGPGKAHVYGRRGAQQVAIKGDAFFFGMWSFAVLVETSMRPGLVPAVICIVRSHLASITAGGYGSSSNMHALDVAFVAYISCCAGA